MASPDEARRADGYDPSRKVRLGATELEVSRLGIGAAYGPSRRACCRAFDAGVNYFFWGSVRARGMALALRDLLPRHRDELVIVLQCYVRWPSLVGRSIDQGLRALGIDQVDVLLLGWHERHPPPRLLEAVEQQRRRDRFRHLAISSHQRPLFRELLEDGRYGIFHVRYNPAHPGAEQDVFPQLPESGGPGIVSFTNTRWGELLDPAKMPPGEAPLTAADCYRFALANPHVHVAISGPKSDEEMDHALTVLRSPLPDAEELARMRAIGRYVHEQRSLVDWFR